MHSTYDKRKRKQNHHAKRFNITLFILFASLIMIGIMVSPVFAVRDVQVVGNKIHTKEDIVKMIDLSKNNNFFFLLTSDINKRLKKYSKIETSKVDFIFPNMLKVEVTENPPIGYICHSSEYVYIDKKGIVIEISNKPPQNIPIITGLDVDGFELGKELKISNKELFSSINTLSNVMQKYNLMQKKIMVDLSNQDDIHIYVNSLDIKFGKFDHIDEKVSSIAEVMKHISEKDLGTLDLSTYKNKIIFSPIE